MVCGTISLPRTVVVAPGLLRASVVTPTAEHGSTLFDTNPSERTPERHAPGGFRAEVRAYVLARLPTTRSPRTRRVVIAGDIVSPIVREANWYCTLSERFGRWQSTGR